MGERTMKALLSRGIGSCAQAFAGVLAKCISVRRVPSR